MWLQIHAGIKVNIIGTGNGKLSVQWEPLTKPTMTYHLDPYEWNSMKFESQYEDFY